MFRDRASPLASARSPSIMASRATLLYGVPTGDQTRRRRRVTLTSSLSIRLPRPPTNSALSVLGFLRCTRAEREGNPEHHETAQQPPAVGNALPKVQGFQ